MTALAGIIPEVWQYISVLLIFLSPILAGPRIYLYGRSPSFQKALKIQKHQVVDARKQEITSLSLGCKIRAWSKEGEAAHKKMLPTPPSLLLYLYL